MFQHLLDPKTDKRLQNKTYRQRRTPNLLVLGDLLPPWRLPINRKLFRLEFALDSPKLLRLVDCSFFLHRARVDAPAARFIAS